MQCEHVGRLLAHPELVRFESILAWRCAGRAHTARLVCLCLANVARSRVDCGFAAIAGWYHQVVLSRARPFLALEGFGQHRKETARPGFGFIECPELFELHQVGDDGKAQ